MGVRPHIRFGQLGRTEIGQAGLKRLRRRREIARHRACGRTFFDRCQRTPIAPVENIEMSLLGGDDNCRRRRHVRRFVDRNENGLRRQIEIPDVVMGGLKTPAQRAGLRVNGDDRAGELLRRCEAFAAEEVGRFVPVGRYTGQLSSAEIPSRRSVCRGYMTRLAAAGRATGIPDIERPRDCPDGVSAHDA
jgi:hypothetical protein